MSQQSKYRSIWKKNEIWNAYFVGYGGSWYIGGAGMSADGDPNCCGVNCGGVIFEGGAFQMLLLIIMKTERLLKRLLGILLKCLHLNWLFYPWPSTLTKTPNFGAQSMVLKMSKTVIQSWVESSEMTRIPTARCTFRSPLQYIAVYHTNLLTCFWNLDLAPC